MKSNDERTPLWRQLQATAMVVQAVREGHSGTVAVEDVPAEIRPAVQSLAFHVWRNLGRAESLRKLLVAKQPPPVADALLCVALALGWSQTGATYDVFTLVNQTVEAAKRNSQTRAQANFINACLRRFLRERAQLIAATDQDLVACWNHPRWWTERLQQERPEQWTQILSLANMHAPMTLRVNVRKTTTEAYLQTLQDSGIKGNLVGPFAITLEKPVPVHRLPHFNDGYASVQDLAAQMAAPLLLAGLAAQGRPRILDACAAPGGKTGHLLELTDADVTALEIDPIRCGRITQNLARLTLSAAVVAADATRPDTWWDGTPFDAILLDAPCTASGIVRRHPDIRWLRRDSDVAQLAAAQEKILETLWPLLRPGGRLLYCTCSVFLAEGETRAQTFLKRNTDATLLPSPGHLLPGGNVKVDRLLDNYPTDHDGFYYALFQKHGV